ncbi:MaoC family dehydratase N-terminal domain-containing protein [Rhodococcus sp. ARC_M6]|uniref:FAS1-like dehydratase domain-containing protein n=1 Tax=Rhodococcus sp. ARC_M6 TaxID=2928852 RepID=UPI001FB20E01|nr:MaoC family dehydratase N-terminal domain-containing protein [Rhodococcus sp. ARC_M6]MCJ0902867.1 MaoC family dehydratase N-terminal domain-containing protein [Rhodococcus sp. ARC_M6]
MTENMILIPDSESLVPDEVAARIGDVVSEVTGAVVARDWQRWAVSVGETNLLYFDGGYARAHGYRDIVCPPLYLQYAILGVTPISELRVDGSSGAASGNLVFPLCPKRMAGGENTTFFGPGYDGDVVTSVRVVDSVEEKRGRSGRFVLVTWKTIYTNQNDEVLAEATTSMIARP